MCRFAVYVGPKMRLSLMVTDPQHSIVRQSIASREREEPLNGDGFGVAWFAPELSEIPAVFRSVSPAWSNINLKHLARVTESSCILAHVRAASPGLPVTELNCHPFHWRSFAFMHNGFIPQFHLVKRKIQESLSDVAYGLIQGSTDSEHIFGLFVDHYRATDSQLDKSERMAQALLETVVQVEALRTQAGIQEQSQLNLVVTDGDAVAVTRFCSPGEERPNSLYINGGKRYVCMDGVCYMLDLEDDKDEAVVIASEPLSEEPGWEPAAANTLFLVGADRQISSRPIPT